jgi:hypothetical protein
MELVAELLKLQEQNKPKTVSFTSLIETSDIPDRNGRVYPADSFRLAFRDDIVATFNGQVIGTIQPIRMNARLEPAPSRELGSFIDCSLGTDRQITVSYDWEESYRMPSRAERRTKTVDDNLSDSQIKRKEYRKGINTMLGGRNKWN